jgi:hypothetical protein
VALLRTHGWRLALAASGITMLIGGPMHPEAEAKHPLREELAIMTAHPNWVPAHLFVVLSTALLAVGLVAAYRGKAWPAIHRALGVAALAVSLYLVETVFHLAAVVDSDNLHHGHSAPVAFTHVGLSVLLYPVAGLAIAYLASRQLVGWRGPRRITGLLGMAGGLVHALSVPLVLALPDTELSLMFAGSAVLIAVWSLVTGLAGAPRAAGVPAARHPVAV